MEEEHSSSETTNGMSKTWRGTSIANMCKGKGPWSFSITPIIPSKYHWILYEMPVTLQSSPKPHYSSQFRLWDDDHVRMPYSDKNLFPVSEEFLWEFIVEFIIKQECPSIEGMFIMQDFTLNLTAPRDIHLAANNGVDDVKPRWTIINEVLSRPISSSYEFETALGKYNNSLPKLEALHYFFNELLDPEESEPFFANILPKIVKLALKLPELVPRGIPLLKQNHNRSLSLSQLQIACLLANAFLCTFPWRKNVAQSYPGVNMIGLFSSFARPKRKQCICEKFKCLCNYFRRVTQNDPVGVVTFERKLIPRNSMPRWDKVENNLGNTRIHVSSAGTIEDNGLGFLQVDFANKNIGGGVLRYGCVQEEIRFVICPELIISRLFVEQLGKGEAVVVTGAERYNNYSGYGDTFEWEGNCNDDTPRDVYGRRKTTICVIDATRFNKTKEQFYSSLILRELNKAYVGFSSREKDNLAPVATGNWGCGAFQGSKQLKTLIQLMACSAAGRDMVYYSFGDEELMESFYQIHLFLANKQITVAQLWRFLCRFSIANLNEEKLYSFIQQAYFDSKKQPSISKYFVKKLDPSKGEPPPPIPSTSSENETLVKTYSRETSPKKNKSDEAMDTIEEPSSSSSSESIIPSSQPEPKPFKKIMKLKQKKSTKEILDKLPRTDICDIFDMLDGNANQSKRVTKTSESPEDQGVLSVFDTFRTKRVDTVLSANEAVPSINKETLQTALEEVIVIPEENMEVDDAVLNHKSSKKKITDYFNKTS